MGCALKLGHGWLTSVGGGWTKENDIYNNRDLPKGRGDKKKERGSWEGRGAGNTYPWTRSPFSLGRRAVWFYILSSYLIIAPTPKPAVAPSEPNFWIHSLQIHCNGSAGPKFHPSLGPVRKTRSYTWHTLWVSCQGCGMPLRPIEDYILVYKYFVIKLILIFIY